MLPCSIFTLLPANFHFMSLISFCPSAVCIYFSALRGHCSCLLMLSFAPSSQIAIRVKESSRFLSLQSQDSHCDVCSLLTRIVVWHEKGGEEEVIPVKVIWYQKWLERKEGEASHNDGECPLQRVEREKWPEKAKVRWRKTEFCPYRESCVTMKNVQTASNSTELGRVYQSFERYVFRLSTLDRRI